MLRLSLVKLTATEGKTSGNGMCERDDVDDVRSQFTMWYHGVDMTLTVCLDLSSHAVTHFIKIRLLRSRPPRFTAAPAGPNNVKKTDRQARLHFAHTARRSAHALHYVTARSRSTSGIGQ